MAMHKMIVSHRTLVNGKMKVTKQMIPLSCSECQVRCPDTDVWFFRFPVRKNQQKISGLMIHGVNNFMLLYRFNIYWLAPIFGSEFRKIPKDTQMLLCRRHDGQYILSIPLIDGEIKTSMSGRHDNTVTLDLAGTSQFEFESAELLAVAVGSNPYELMSRLMSSIQRSLKTFRLLKDKKVPDYVNYLGWCTWDAFRQEVCEEKLLSGYQSFKDIGIEPEVILIDDGWQKLDNERRTTSFVPDPQKFPQGFLALKKKLKQHFALKYFGVWQTLQGYWQGINPDAFSEYATFTNFQSLPTFSKNKQAVRTPLSKEKFKLTGIHPDSAGDYFSDLHKSLKSQGVDFVKIDNQAGLECFFNGLFNNAVATQKYQKQLQKSVKKTFGNGMLTCMGSCPEIIFNMYDSVVFRNSDDYFPHRNFAAQQHHIHTNGMNAFWTSTFCLPDYDMFQTHALGAVIHAPARAISGGPVYVSDTPYKQKVEFLVPLLDGKGVPLRPDRPALPAEDCLLVDCEHSECLYKLTNKIGKAGVLAVFNCCTNRGHNNVIKGKYSASDIHDLSGIEFIAFNYRYQSVEKVLLNTYIETAIKPYEFEYIVFVPIENSVAIIGDMDKYNSPAIFKTISWISPNILDCVMRSGGKAAFYCEKEPVRVETSHNMDNREYRENKLLILRFNTREEVHIKLFF